MEILLSNQRNKQQFIDMLSSMLVHAECEIIQVKDNADVVIVTSAVDVATRR